eukprot:1245952-Alexandrium_andersonii.AAC.1
MWTRALLLPDVSQVGKLTATKQRYLGELQNALEAQHVDPRSNLGAKFSRSLKLDKDALANYKKLSSDIDRRKFR